MNNELVGLLILYGVILIGILLICRPFDIDDDEDDLLWP